MRSVGFDLDMTLVDSADGIVLSVQHVIAQYGIDADGEEIRSTIGLPLDQVFPRWLPDEPYDVLLAAYRAHYREHGIPLTRPMPGARDAIAAVRDRGDRVLVVTAKYGAVAHLALRRRESNISRRCGRFGFGSGLMRARRVRARVRWVRFMTANVRVDIGEGEQRRSG